MSIWDDGYGISVPNEYQITKRSLSDMLRGFQRTDSDGRFRLEVAPGVVGKVLANDPDRMLRSVAQENVAAFLADGFLRALQRGERLL